MILTIAYFWTLPIGKPRASGDDPHLAAGEYAAFR